MTRLLLIFLILIMPCMVSAQVNESWGSVNNSELNELITQYRKSDGDTNSVRLLLKIDSLYLYKMLDTKKILDSAVLMSAQARNLCSALHFDMGYRDATFILANSYAEEDDIPSAISVMNQTKGSLKIDILIMIGERYLFRQGELKENLDSAFPFIMRAKNLSDSLKTPFWIHKSLCLMAKYNFARGNMEFGKQCFQLVINDYKRSGDRNNEAFWYTELGRYIPHTDSTIPVAIQCFDRARILYHLINNQQRERDAVENIAYLQLLQNNLDPAEKGFLEAISLRKSMGETRFFGDYSSLARINLIKGNYHKTLFYALASVDNLDSARETDRAGVIYSQLADAYRVLGETNKSLEWYKASLNELVAYRIQFMYTICFRIVHALIEKDSAKEALSFLEKFISENPPPRYVDKEIITASLGDCNYALGKYAIAENNYLQMINLDSLTREHFKNVAQGEIGNIITGSEAYFKIGSFYVDREKYELGRPFLLRAISFVRFAPGLSRIRDIHFLLFKIDSAKGDYISAIQHFELTKQLNDSIFNENKSRQVEELQIQYESVKKERDIQLLEKGNKLQQENLEKANISRNWILGVVALMLVIIGMMANYSRLKQNTNKKLKAQQIEISQKNVYLQHVVEEKDWLVKEIHHRVKNNFHTVMGLLGTQSGYLKNEEAISAISESKQRIQVMSLIHQKLYQSDNLSAVNMPDYIQELVEYFKDGLMNRKQILFKLDIDALMLDFSYAIPLGLILNEAVTNSIKYAFSKIREGIITIDLHQISNKQIELVITDNGQGLPFDFQPYKRDSMGMNLMQGLSEDIGGEFSICSNVGTKVYILFSYEFERENYHNPVNLKPTGSI